MRYIVSVLVAAALAAAPSYPQAPPDAPEETPEIAEEEAEKPAVEIGGFIDLYATYNANRPFDRQNFFPTAGIAGKRANEAELNLAAIEIRRAPEPVGFHLIAGVGNELEILHAGEPAGEAIGRDTFRNVYRASVSYAATDRLLLEGGIYPSHIAFETALSKDVWNYTGSWVSNFTPYYQTGVRAAYTFNEQWSGELHVLSGWQIIGDNNDAKSLGTRLAWTGPRASVALNGWVGPELPQDDSSLRTLLDLVATAKVGDTVDLVLQVDGGRQALPQGPDAEWNAVAGWVRWAFRPDRAVILRLERFDDPDGGISGLPQTLEEGTLTLDLRPHEQVIVKLEGRYDRSTAAVFSGETAGRPEREQLLFAVATIFTF